MSHTVKVKKLQMKNLDAIVAAAERVGAKVLHGGQVRKHYLYAGTYEGVGVQLKGWKYPVVVNTDTGEVYYDNFNGAWGDPAQLDQFGQYYAVEAAKQEALLHGMTVEEIQLENGEIELRLTQYEG